MNDHVADRLGNVVVTNGVVRLDFLCLRAGDGDGKLELEPALAVALPRVIAMLENLRNQLQKLQVPAPESPSVPAAAA
jgi:hypothetical protein